MHARLTNSERQKIEKDIGSLVHSLNEAIGCGENQIAQLEKLLDQTKKELAAAAASASDSAGQIKDLQAQVAALKDELGARNADISVLKLEVKSLTKDNESLQKQLAGNADENQRLRDKLEAVTREKDQAASAGADFEREISSLITTITEFESLSLIHI